MGILCDMLQLRNDWYKKEVERCIKSGDKKINPVFFS